MNNMRIQDSISESSMIEIPGAMTPWFGINQLLHADERLMKTYEHKTIFLLAPKSSSKLSALMYMLKENHVPYTMIDQEPVSSIHPAIQVFLTARAFNHMNLTSYSTLEVEVGCPLNIIHNQLYEWGYEINLDPWIWETEHNQTLIHCIRSESSSGRILRRKMIKDRLIGVEWVKRDGSLLQWGGAHSFSLGPVLYSSIWGCHQLDGILTKCYFKVDPLPAVRLFLCWSFQEREELWALFTQLKSWSSVWERLDCIIPSSLQEKALLLGQISGTEEEMHLFKRACPGFNQAYLEDRIRSIRHFLLQQGLSFIPCSETNEETMRTCRYMWHHAMTNVSWMIR